jgi:F0F1-type ATP synthase membrane subunit b/b'
MDAASESRVEAAELKRHYEEKLDNIDAEIAALKNEARIVIDQSRQQMLSEVQTQIDQLMNQTEDALSRLRSKAVHQHKEALGNIAATFAQGILSDVMTPELSEVFQQELISRIAKMDLLPFIEGTPPGKVSFIRTITAQQPSAPFREQLTAIIREKLNQDVQISFDVDSSLIAGGILKFENKLLDGSLRGQINALEQHYREIA